MKKYRLLEKGDIIRKGDQVLDNHNSGSSKWTNVRASIGSHVSGLFVGQFRRPLKPVERPRVAGTRPKGRSVWAGWNPEKLKSTGKRR